MNEYSKYQIYKSAIEDLFGKNAWYDLKESNHVPTWKNYAEKTLKAIEFCIKSTIEIYDEDWIYEIEKSIEKGHESIKLVDSIDEIIASIAGTLINLTFLQIGFMPKRKGKDVNVPFRNKNWCFNQYRTAMYLQTPDQKDKLFKDIQKKKSTKSYK